MSAQDNLSPKQFFHGTTEWGLEPSEDRIEPGHSSNWPGTSDPGKVYFARTRKDALHWARKSAKADLYGRPPVVYKVRPTGPYEPDEHGEGYQSSHPLDILQEMTREGWQRSAG